MILVAHSFFLCRDAKQFERAKPYPPLTTLLTAAILRGAGHQVALFDATFADGPEAFEAILDTLAPSVVLLIEDSFNFLTKMCTENRRQDALAMISAARQRNCGIAVNGPDPSDHPALYFDAGADAILTGEGEFSAEDVVAAFLRDDDSLGATPGLMLNCRPGHLHYTAPRPKQTDLDALPLPAWDLIDAEAYRRTWLPAHGFLSWNVAASRGCTFNCNWCAKPTFGRRYTQRSPAAVADELAQLKSAVGPDHIWFVDDIFGMTTRWIEAFAAEVKARDAVIPFMMQSRSSLIDERAAAALREAGAKEVWLGVESGSQRILDAMDKGTRVEEARCATRRLRREGIRVAWFLQLGYPPEDWDDIVMTRDLVRQEAPDEIGVSVSYPLPGTVFYERIAEQLGERRNWRHTDDLAMLFRGTFDTGFYRQVRDALHAEVDSKTFDDDRWSALADRLATHRLAGGPLGLSA